MKEIEKQIDMNARWENLGISNDFLLGRLCRTRSCARNCSKEYCRSWK